MQPRLLQFHGTSISLLQHPTVNQPGVEQNNMEYVDTKDTKTVNPLPDFYGIVPPAVLKNKDPPIPPNRQDVMDDAKVYELQ